jgi:hypothetical protein
MIARSERWLSQENDATHHGANAMTRRAQDNTKAFDAFLAAKFEIDAMLARLQSLSDAHFDASPDEISWAHVGTLSHYRDKLREITDSAFREGEYAE